MLGSSCNSSTEVHNYIVFIIELLIKATAGGETRIKITVSEAHNIALVSQERWSLVGN